MKSIVTAVILFLVCSIRLNAQTEIWRLDGEYGVAVHGDNNSLYLAHGTDWGLAATPLAHPKNASRMHLKHGHMSRSNRGIDQAHATKRVQDEPDSLIKVSSDGDVLWAEELPATPNVLFAGDRIYALFQSDLQRDSVICFDTSGAVKWNYGYTNEGADVHKPATLDQSGNFYVLIQSPPSILRLDTGGVAHLQSLPTWLTIAGDEGNGYLGPFIDNAGNILVLSQGTFFTEKLGKNGSVSDEDDGYLYLTKLSSSTLLPINATKPWVGVIKKELLTLESDNAKGTTIETAVDDAAYYPIGMLNGTLTLYNMHHLYSDKVSPTKETVQDLSEWRILTVDSKLKGKLFKFKGKGLDKCKDASNSEVSDFYGNVLDYFGKGHGDTLYLSGTTAVGKGVCGTPELAQYGTLAQFNVASKKMKWTKSAISQPVGQTLVSASGELLLLYGGDSIATYNGAGSAGPAMTFEDDFYNFIPQPADLNREGGYIYLNLNDGIDGPYLAKFSVPGFAVPSGTVLSSRIAAPKVFRLDQNYPNPFNPTTLIRFELPVASTVTLRVYNLLGQEVATLANNEAMEVGNQEIAFDASTVASGVYFYKLDATGVADENGKLGQKYSSLKKMVVIK